jgi:hypothetical protein
MVGAKGMVEYAAIAGGVAVGFILSRTIVKANTRIADALNSVLPSGGEWLVWGSKLLALAIWGTIGLMAYRKWQSADGIAWSILLGVAGGGVAEEIANLAGM